MYDAFPGNKLRERRESLGWSKEEVFERCKVWPDYVDALEEGRLDVLPEPCFAVGYLRTYCSCLGLDPESFVGRYKSCMRAHPAHKRNHAIPATGPASTTWLTEAFTIGAICFLVGLGWFTYSILTTPLKENSENQADAAQMEIVVPEPPADYSY